MIEKKKKGNVVIFRRVTDLYSEYIGLYPKRKIGEKEMSNVVYQKWIGNIKASNIGAWIDNVDEWANKEQLTDEEFEKLKDLIMDNVVLW